MEGGSEISRTAAPPESPVHAHSDLMRGEGAACLSLISVRPRGRRQHWHIKQEPKGEGNIYAKKKNPPAEPRTCARGALRVKFLRPAARPLMQNSRNLDPLGGVFNGPMTRAFFFLAEVKDKRWREGDADVSGKKRNKESRINRGQKKLQSQITEAPQR